MGTSIELYIDRRLPITISEQIKGQVAYSIMCGRLHAGQTLPSIRSLSRTIGVSSVTVSQAYRALAQERLVLTRHGRGTFVADVGQGDVGNTVHSAREGLRRIVDASVRQALSLGFPLDEIRSEFLSWIEACRLGKPTCDLVLIGNFKAATESYAREIEAILHDLGVKVSPKLLCEVESDLPRTVDELKTARLVITIPSRLREVSDLLEPHGIRVRAVAFQASAETRRRLSLIPPADRLGVVATYSEFLGSLLNEVASYCLSQTPPLSAVLGQTGRIKRMLSQIDVLVYASGSDKTLEWLPDGIKAIEYLHAPEPDSVNRLRQLLVESSANEPAA
jgi:DNA-binding transcriptional regulator YhcF (GntR family)